MPLLSMGRSAPSPWRPSRDGARSQPVGPDPNQSGQIPTAWSVQIPTRVLVGPDPNHGILISLCASNENMNPDLAKLMSAGQVSFFVVGIWTDPLPCQALTSIRLI